MTPAPRSAALRTRHTLALLLALAAAAACAPEAGGAPAEPQAPAEPAPAPDTDRPKLTLGVVPQQSASRLAQQWLPLLAHVSARAGVEVVFKTAPDIPTFERRCAEGAYDLAYMNPYHYTVFHEDGYQAIAKRANSKIKGIIVKRKDSPARQLTDLDGAQLAFPAPRAFAATLLTRAGLKKAGVAYTPNYVSSHDSVYLNVARGKYAAGGGIMRTFKSVDAEVQEQLEVLWQTPGYTPHAFAAHERVDARVRDAVTAVLLALGADDEGRALLAPLNISGLEAASDSDWDDVRALNIEAR